MLDELNGVVAALKARIEQHRDILSRNEAVTRYALIDPLLTALGWNLADPAQVQPEYHTGNGIADYMMLAGRSNPQAVIEAKRLGVSVSEGISQAISYCLEHGVPYFVVTNGAEWHAYETHRMGPLDEKRIVQFSLSGATQPAAMKALWLWRGNFEVGAPVMPVIPESQVQPAPTDVVPVIDPPVTTTGMPLSTFHVQPGEPPPAALVFPDSIVKPIRNWTYLQAVVVEWLTETDQLTPAHCPLTTPSGGAYLVNVTATKANGSPFLRPIQAGGLWIDADHVGSSLIRRANQILQARNVDPATVRVVPRN